MTIFSCKGITHFGDSGPKQGYSPLNVVLQLKCAGSVPVVVIGAVEMLCP